VNDHWLVTRAQTDAFKAEHGVATTPQVFIDGKRIGGYVDLRFGSGTRSLELGSESQVSLPTGELADQRVRWSSGRLVVERKVPRGAKLVETYRLLPGTGQLEVTMRRSGGDGFPKIEWRRVFDREPAAAAAGGTPSAVP
jgi:hypothetical protein